jgi:AcrR family transcriptional regulator
VTGFQRARQPEQKTFRRETLIAAATSLFDEEGPTGTGLNAIAARAGFTKSNIYRYFESREEVLLTLLLQEQEAFVAALIARLDSLTPGFVGAAAAAISSEFLARQRYCKLISMTSSVLEQNVSEDSIATYKRAINAQIQPVAPALMRALPSLTLADAQWLVRVVATLIAGMWPAAYPSAAAQRVLDRDEFRGFKPVPEQDLPRAILALLRGIGA